MTKVRIVNTNDDDYSSWESVEVYIGDKLITEITTSYESPEDNSVSRLGISEGFAELAKALGAEVENA